MAVEISIASAAAASSTSFSLFVFGLNRNMINTGPPSVATRYQRFLEYNMIVVVVVVVDVINARAFCHVLRSVIVLMFVV